MAQSTPMSGGTYVKLPEGICKRAVVNIKNEDNLCFAWSVLAHFHSDGLENPNRVCNYRKHLTSLKLDGLEMPMAVRDIPRFENMNGMNVDVYGYNKKRNYLYRIYPTVGG